MSHNRLDTPLFNLHSPQKFCKNSPTIGLSLPAVRSILSSGLKSAAWVCSATVNVFLKLQSEVFQSLIDLSSLVLAKIFPLWLNANATIACECPVKVRMFSPPDASQVFMV